MRRRFQDIHLGNIPLLDKIGYGMGNFGFGIIFQIIGTYLVFYSTAVLNVPGKLIGIAVSISTVWDGVTDPMVGYISDRTRSSTLGRRHQYILMGCILAAVFNYSLWVISPEFSETAKFIWILTDLMIIKLSMTVYSTPYTALGAELSYDYDERTVIQGIRTIFFLLGLLSVNVGGMFLFFQPTSEFSQGQLNPEAYRNIGLASSAGILFFGLAAFVSTKRYIPVLPKFENRYYKEKKSIFSIFASFLSVLKNRNYKLIVVAYLFTNISSALISTLGLHVFTYTFMMDSSSIAVVFGIQFLISILSQPAWTHISKKIDKKPSIMLGLAISIFGSLIFLALVLGREAVRQNYLCLLPVASILGFGTGGLFSIPQSMIADTIDIGELNTGARTEGVYYGCLTLFYKLSQAMPVFLLGVLLDAVKFDPGLEVQSESTVVILGLIIPIGALIGFIMAFVSIRTYDLDKNKVDEIQRKLLRREEDMVPMEDNIISRI